MLQRIREAREADSGFSLIELLIVFVILGVIGGVVVVGVGSFRGDSEVAACTANLKTVQAAQGAYTAKNGAPAPDIATLVSQKYLKAAPPTGDGISLDSTTKEPVSTKSGCTL